MQRLHGLGDRVWNVVQLEVEEDREIEVAHFLDAVTAVRRKEFEAELEAADMMPDAGRDRLRAIDVGRVDGDEYRAFHETGVIVPCGPNP